MASEVLQKGKVYRILADAANQVWDKISFFTHADDVEFSDGQNASIKVGAINGITDDLTCEDPSIAASSVAVKTLNESLVGYPDYTNVITTINATSVTYTATQKGWLIGSIKQTDTSAGPYVQINDITVASIYINTNATLSFNLPVNKGDIIKTGAKGTYSMSLYGIK